MININEVPGTIPNCTCTSCNKVREEYKNAQLKEQADKLAKAIEVKPTYDPERQMVITRDVGYSGLTGHEIIRGNRTLHVLVIPEQYAQDVVEFLEDGDACEDYMEVVADAGMPVTREFHVDLDVTVSKIVTVSVEARDDDEASGEALALFENDPGSYVEDGQYSDIQVFDCYEA